MQVVQVICTMARMKLLSLWVGPLGVGLMGLYMTAVEMVGHLTQFSIRTSAVRDISASSASGSRLATVVLVVRRHAWWLGLLGVLVMLLGAVPLSRYTFGADGHAAAFRVLSVALLLNSLTGGEQAVFQATGRLRELAAGGLWSAVGGLLLSLPLYRWWGVEGVVPSIVLYSVCGLAGVLFYRRRVALQRAEPLTARATLAMGFGFVRVGFYLTLASIIGAVVNYAMMAYVTRTAGEVGLGYFQAGYAMLWRYAAMVFVSVTYEYYPRLASVGWSNWRTSVMVGHEAELVGTLMLPLACLAIALAQPLVMVLYTREFVASVVPYFVWGMAGMMLRPASMAMSYAFLANGRGAMFCATEVASGLIGLALNVLAFHLWGFLGLGLALIPWMLIDCVIIYAAYRRYGLHFSPRCMVATVARMLAASASAAAVTSPWPWLALIPVLLTAIPAVRLLRALRRIGG